jgi:multidrug efflux pump subunit AcrA (membrane-fusion protein)
MGEALVSAARTPPVDASGHCDEAAQRAARRTLRAQIARLEAELADALVASFAMRGRGEGAQPPPTRRGGTPRLLDLGELERARDELAARLQEVRAANARRAADRAARRAELERMRLAPGRYRFTRISSEELGEPGCGVWCVRPRLGLIGMLAGWWQLTLSSGCPLAPL